MITNVQNNGTNFKANLNLSGSLRKINLGDDLLKKISGCASLETLNVTRHQTNSDELVVQGIIKGGRKLEKKTTSLGNLKKTIEAVLNRKG